MSEIEKRQHGDVLEHRHAGYDYWHPASRVHSVDIPDRGLPIGHIFAKVVPYTEEEPEPRGLQVKPFDWAAWDANCEAKGICQGYEEAHTRLTCDQPFAILSECSEWHEPPGFRKELHHRAVAPNRVGIAEVYWQCPHCKQLQKPILWIQGARLRTYHVEVRGNRTVIWVNINSGAWFVLVINGTLQGVAMGVCQGTVYFCGIPSESEAPPIQLPDECSTILARRMWHRLTKGYWSDRKKEDCE